MAAGGQTDLTLVQPHPQMRERIRVRRAEQLGRLVAGSAAGDTPLSFIVKVLRPTPRKRDVAL